MSESPRHSPRFREVNWHWAFVFSIAFLIALVFFAAGVMAERSLFREGRLTDVGEVIGSLGSDSPEAGSADRVDEVRHLLQEEYYYRPSEPAETEAFEQKLEYDAIRGMTEGLDDDYTTFLVPVEQQPIAEQLEGEYEGIGVWVQYPEGRFTIVSAMPGSPAEEAGLRAGDVILEADGHSLTNLSEDDALTLVRGPADSTVRLTIQRLGVEQLIEVEVARRRITMPAVVYEYVEGHNLARIQVTIFGDKTTEQLDAAIRRAEEDGVDGIVLDLRNNGGGWVAASQEMIGRFVRAETGPALYEDSSVAESELQSEPIIPGEEHLFDLPVVVLVNEGTASAAEIVAGALSDYDRAVVVGAKTYGKGSVQRVHDFADGSSARITFALWLTPSKQQIEGVGIQPDIVVAGPTEGSVADPQLDAAVEALVAPATADGF
ncbi:MAG: S41 family peptidase [Thermomicrobiales bacterium]